MNSIVEPQRATKILTEEIIDQFRLPYQICYSFIHDRMERALGIGYNIGKDTTKRNKPVVSLDKNGRIVKPYISLAAAARDVDLKTYTNITRAIKTKKKAAGYYWKLANPDDHYIYRQIK